MLSLPQLMQCTNSLLGMGGGSIRGYGRTHVSNVNKKREKKKKRERKTATNLVSSLSGKSQQLSRFYSPCPHTWDSCHFQYSLDLYIHASIELHVFVIHSKHGKDSRLAKWVWYLGS